MEECECGIFLQHQVVGPFPKTILPKTSFWLKSSLLCCCCCCLGKKDKWTKIFKYFRITEPEGLFRALNSTSCWVQNESSPDKWLSRFCLNTANEGETTIFVANWFQGQTVLMIRMFFQDSDRICFFCNLKTFIYVLYSGMKENKCWPSLQLFFKILKIYLKTAIKSLPRTKLSFLCFFSLFSHNSLLTAIL